MKWQETVKYFSGGITMETNNELLARLDVDLRMRGLSENTQECYKRYVRKFLEFAECEVDKLNETIVRSYLIEMLQSGKVTPQTVNAYNAAIRFFFAITLNRTMNYLQMPRFKKRKTLPEILTREEIYVLFESCLNLKHKAMFMLSYGSGLRIGEVAALRVQDIDSKTMRVFVKNGKGGKDRYTILSHECLCVLREYWSVYRPKHSEGWLFLGQNRKNHILSDSIRAAFDSSIKKVGITKDVSMHTLRHCFATYLLEDGASIFQIKELLGHASLSSTTIYLHLANTTADVQSPADKWVQYA